MYHRRKRDESEEGEKDDHMLPGVDYVRQSTYTPRQAKRLISICAIVTLSLYVFLYSLQVLVPNRKWLLPERFRTQSAIAAEEQPLPPPGTTAEHELPPEHWHPVELLHRAARSAFADLTGRQSRNVDEAVDEYVRRYKRQPPPGFDIWTVYALGNDSPIIDDFDLIMEGLAPYWKMTAGEIKMLLLHAISEDNPSAKVCSFEDGSFELGDCELLTSAFNDYLGLAKLSLPNFDVMINFLLEPSVLPAKEKVNSKHLNALAGVEWHHQSHRNLRFDVSTACKIRGRTAESPFTKYFNPVSTYGIDFVRDVVAEKDLCRRPIYRHRHGIVLGANTMVQMPIQIPLLSRGAPFPWADILVPGPPNDPTATPYDEMKDSNWTEKDNVLYWAGSATGVYAQDDATWKRSHRQRFVTEAQHREPHSIWYLDAERGFHYPYRDTWVDTSLYDVRFTDIPDFSCVSDECKAQKEYYEVDDNSGRQADECDYDARYVMDIDSFGPSQAFYALLESHSCVLKSTLFREWHDERLVPWLHYVPVSMGMAELPELTRFLVDTKQGQEVGQKIAEAGRAWKQKALRPVDRGIYLFRLFIEMAWMMDDSRIPEE
jgi:hypothetical protein